MRLGVAIFAVAVFVPAAASQNVLSVPSATHPTIQSAIDAASPGDIVGVGPGTYVETIDFKGKAILVLGAGPGLCTIDGGGLSSVVTFRNSEGPGSVLDGFTITGGVGTFASLDGLQPPRFWGGGVLIWGSYPNVPMKPTIRNCDIVGNTADAGGGIALVGFAGALVERCTIASNSLNPMNSPIDWRAGGGVYTLFAFSTEIRQCVIAGNSAAGGGGISAHMANGALLRIEDSTIKSNTASSLLPGGGGPSLWDAGGAIIEGSSRIERCTIVDNVATSRGGGLFLAQGNWVTMHHVVNCVIANNRGGTGGGVVRAGGSAFFVNCTFADNLSRDSAGVPHWGGGLLLDGFAPMTDHAVNCIFWGNQPDQVRVDTGVASLWNCIAQGTLLPIVGQSQVWNVDPLFLDPMNGDYRIGGASPAVNLGLTFHPLTSLPSFDLLGHPRNIAGSPDVGAYEASDVSVLPVSAGNVGGPSGPENVLLVNGASGGADRRVRVGVGQSISVTMATPSQSPAPSDFALFGILKEADWRDPVMLPSGLGEMAFPPCPLLPSASPFLFTAASSFGAGPCGAILAGPTPWVSPTIVVPFPLAFTLQGIVTEGPGVLRVTNAVIVEVK